MSSSNFRYRRRSTASGSTTEFYSADEFDDIIEEGEEEEEDETESGGEEQQQGEDHSNTNNTGGIDQIYETVDYYDDYVGGYNDDVGDGDNAIDDNALSDRRQWSDSVNSGLHTDNSHSPNSNSNGNNPHPASLSIISSEDSRDYGGSTKATASSSHSHSHSPRTYSSSAAPRNAGSAFKSTIAVSSSTRSSSTSNASGNPNAADLLRQRKRRIETDFMHHAQHQHQNQQSQSGSSRDDDGKTPVVRNSAYNTVRQRFFENGVSISPHKSPKKYYNNQKKPTSTTAAETATAGSTTMMNGGTSSSSAAAAMAAAGHGPTNRSRTRSQDGPPQQPTRTRGGPKKQYYQAEEAKEDHDGSSPQHLKSELLDQQVFPPTSASSQSNLPSELPIFHSSYNNTSKDNTIQFGATDSYGNLNVDLNSSNGQSKARNNNNHEGEYENSEDNSNINNNMESPGSSAAYSRNSNRHRRSQSADQTPVSSTNSYTASSVGSGGSQQQLKRGVRPGKGGATSAAAAFAANNQQSLSLLSPGLSAASHLHNSATNNNLGASKSSISFSVNSPLYSKKDTIDSRMLDKDRIITDMSAVRQVHSSDDAPTLLVRNNNNNNNEDLYDGVERDRRDGGSRARADTEQSSKAMMEDGDILSADGVGDDDSDESETFEPYVFCGITCNTWCSKMIKNPLTLHQVSLCIVKSAPCFWLCCCDKDDLQGGATSDRLVLGRLNVIAFFFTFMQVVSAIALATIMFWTTGKGSLELFAPHLWNANGAVFALGMIGAFIMFVCLCTVRIIREVDLTGAIRYMWIILWILPAEIFFTITLFDYHRVTEVWVVHWWNDLQLSWFRETFCLPGTADTLCAVPIDGGPDYDDEEAWCRANYDSTQCESIRDSAQEDTVFWLLVFYTALASWSVILIFILLLVVNSLERIISKPIVQKSRESNVPGWLTFPTIATAFVGLVYYISPSSVLRVLDAQSWVAFLYLFAAGLFLVAFVLGWGLSVFPVRSDTDKRSKSSFVVVFIVVLAVNAALLLTIFVASIIWSRTLDLNQRDRGNVACVLKSTDCTNCDAAAAFLRCPEWSLDDVYSITQTQLKQSATLAAIFILYAVNVMIYGIVLKRHLANYQIDYV